VLGHNGSAAPKMLLGETLSLHRIMSSRKWAELLVGLGHFSTLRELLQGAYLLHSFRVFERQMGSRKFGSCCFLMMVLATTLELGLSLRIPSLSVRKGPISLLGALASFYAVYVPGVRLPSLPAPLNSKSFTYFMSGHMLLAGGWSSIVPGVAGIVAACIWASEALPFRNFLLPKPVRRVLGALHPLLRVRDPREEARRRRQEMRNIAPHRVERQGAPGAGGAPFAGVRHPGVMHYRRAAAAAAPPPEAIAALEALGFDRDSAARALRETGNNLEAAANSLLGH
jgi:hypothetical protein